MGYVVLRFGCADMVTSVLFVASTNSINKTIWHWPPFSCMSLPWRNKEKKKANRHPCGVRLVPYFRDLLDAKGTLISFMSRHD